MQNERSMKRFGLNFLSGSAFLSALFALQANSWAGQEHGSAMQVQGRPVADWVADVKTQGGVREPNPALDVLVSAGQRVQTNLADLLLHDPSTTQQVRAAGAIGAVAYRNPGAPELAEAVRALALAAENEDLRLRVMAIQGLGATGKAAGNTIPLLVRSAKDENESVRTCAVEALGRIGVTTPQTVDALKGGMADPSGDVRVTAVQALRKSGQPASNTIPVLVRLTKDESVGVRCAAVEAPGQVGVNSPEAVAALKSALQDPSEDFVRPLARKALKAVETNQK
jgi:hypothetical protein